jgi:hypothetical protein
MDKRMERRKSIDQKNKLCMSASYSTLFNQF